MSTGSLDNGTGEVNTVYCCEPVHYVTCAVFPTPLECRGRLLTRGNPTRGGGGGGGLGVVKHGPCSLSFSCSFTKPTEEKLLIKREDVDLLRVAGEKKQVHHIK
ncbi:unnamed protein product [Gadus morhua 'NCC']